MNPPSSSGVGFRLIFRRPAIPLAEITWRWCFAAAAWTLGIVFIFVYLDSLPVTGLDRLLLYTGQPFLIAHAIRHIFAGSSVRFIEGAILVLLTLMAAWIFVASLARLAIVRSMVAEFGINLPDSRGQFSSLLVLNFLRAAVTLAAIVGIIGAALMTSSLWASTHMAIGDASRIVFVLWFLIALAWTVLNWLLSTATVLVVAKRESTFSSVASTLRALQNQSAAMMAPGALFGIPHLVGFGVAFVAVLFLLPITIAHPVGLLVLWPVILIYSIFANSLYTARLAAYAFVACGGENMADWVTRRPIPPQEPRGAVSAVDKDELILSDLPQPAT
jgi:hypothetical protein